MSKRSENSSEFPNNGNTSKPNLNNFYADGFGQIREGLFSGFRPVLGYFGGEPPAEIKKSEDEEWEIPFDAISRLERLGSGSQGAVFRGQYQNRTVAVKKVNQLKETEIKHLRHLRHKNIIEFLGVCSKSPCYCIVMEYCSKGQLYTVLKTKNTITRELFSQWMKKIADGMHYLHQNKVIHRNLKSPNILISEEDSIKICNFGTSFCGTVRWMAPEMIKKEPCNEKVDVYSFGVVLWEMLTRETPYANIHQMAIIFGVGTNILSLPMPEEAPRGLVLLIKQCLSRKGRNRPSFSHIRQHWELFKPELFEMTEEEWQVAWDSYREFAKAIQYPSTVTKDHGGKNAFAMEEELRQKRHMYETKLQRTNKMMDKLQGLFIEFKLKEQELAEWHRELTDLQFQLHNSPRAMSNAPRPLRGNRYPNEAYECISSDDEGQGQAPASGSAGQKTRRGEGANQWSWWRSNGAGGGQHVTMAQNLYRNGDGRWWDGRTASRRRVSSPKPPVFFTRDSPSRVPHGVVNYSSLTANDSEPSAGSRGSSTGSLIEGFEQVKIDDVESDIDAELID